MVILRSPYGIVHDANEMRMTWSANGLENVLGLPRKQHRNDGASCITHKQDCGKG